jgi:hypothetical protein
MATREIQEDKDLGDIVAKALGSGGDYLHCE